MAAAGDKDVCRLDVAMHDALGVGGIESVGDVDRRSQQGLSFQRLAVDAVPQGYAVEILHDDEGVAIVLVNFVNRADVGVVEGGSRLALRAESGPGPAGLGRHRRAET